jgi:dipeptidyl aminopeptidase/acylaminoacyl peptidase
MASYRLEDAEVLDDAASAPTKETETKRGAPGKVDALDLRKAYDRASSLALQAKGRVFKATLTPHWIENNTHMWYRNDLRDARKEFVLVNAEKGTRLPAFDHAKLARELSKASGKSFDAGKLPFDLISFTPGLKGVRFHADGRLWECDLTSYACGLAQAAPESEERETSAAESVNRDVQPEEGEELEEPAAQAKQGKASGSRAGTGRETRSPDGAWTAFIKDNNVFMRGKEGKEIRVTSQGDDKKPFSGLTWSPDGKTLVAYRTAPGDNAQVYMIETSPRDQLAAKLHTRAYPRAGDKLPRHDLWLIHPGKTAPVMVDVEAIDLGGPPRLRWSKDSQRFTFEKRDRGHRRFRVIEVDARTGKTRNIIDERAKSFIWTDHLPSGGELGGVAVYYLRKTNEIIFVTQQDGWKHLYLVDAAAGKTKNQITRGPWVVRAIDRIDEEKRQIWFRAAGKNPDQDPYLVHYYRVNFDGGGLVALTASNGNHQIQYSPDKSYIIDTYSRVDMPPAHELRRVSDGSLVCALEQADVSALEETGWKAPEVFVAKGRDGVTDIWGIICRPQHYDPKKKYPVIEYIYAGPHGFHTPKTFAAYRPLQALAELGFIVVQCDGMGTAQRSRAFHDVCWKNLADAGFPDRILWIRAAAKKYAYLDITRVGIYGTSAGGQNAAGALLFHPEFYKVAVAACGCHDNRLDKRSWNEQWMGLMGPHYHKQSNVTNAHWLEGKLLLIVGELDTNVPFESTMRVVDALIRARKDFDLLVVPGMGHSDGGAYGQRRRWDFFVRHLHGVEPPRRRTAEERVRATAAEQRRAEGGL